MTPDHSPSLPELKQLYRWTASLFDTLAALRRRFGGDLDQYLLYMLFVQAEMALASSGRRCGSAGLNALSAAEISGIPRETARAKLGRMTGFGLLRLGRDGLHYLSATADAPNEYGALTRFAGPSA